MEKLVFDITSKTEWEAKLLFFFSQWKNVVFINSNNQSSNLLAVSNSLKVNHQGWRFGFVSYDYKNHLEDLSSENVDGIGFSDKHFFTPELLFEIQETTLTINYAIDLGVDYVNNLFSEILQVNYQIGLKKEIELNRRISKDEYLTKISQLKEHIQVGDIYEINFCQEFYSEKVDVSPIDMYHWLNEKSPTPFSCFVKCDKRYVICASPERFILKEKGNLISQPIKGTIKRGQTETEDNLLKQQLLSDPKEQRENVMIVDLVRNDLARIAKKNSVTVDELFGIYTFPQVHQMISTIRAEVEENIDFEDVLKATFPMGSMTGAPKIKAMGLIEKYESTKRGLFSGSIGFITPENDFNFNVVIRSILYNAEQQYLSFLVGGAITSLSDPEMEYEECMLKAKAIKEVLTKDA